MIAIDSDNLDLASVGLGKFVEISPLIDVNAVSREVEQDGDGTLIVIDFLLPVVETDLDDMPVHAPIFTVLMEIKSSHTPQSERD